MTTGYCMKCKQKREMKNAKKTKVNGRDAFRGACSKCGTNMFKFGSS
jgi:hypothetical protein